LCASLGARLSLRPLLPACALNWNLLLPPAALLKNTNDGKSVVLARLKNAAIVNAPNVYPLNGPTANWTRLWMRR
jgi:hypothetical protein